MNNPIPKLRKQKPRIDKNGTKRWYLNRKLHREDGPAVEFKDGEKNWYINGKRHREDGPAIIDKYGNKSWFQNDLQHREDGPAIENASEQYRHRDSWWYRGKWLFASSIDDYKHAINRLKREEYADQYL